MVEKIKMNADRVLLILKMKKVLFYQNFLNFIYFEREHVETGLIVV